MPRVWWIGWSAAGCSCATRSSRGGGGAPAGHSPPLGAAALPGGDGLTAKRLEQIHRAGRALELLAAGKRAIDVALELGYSDQAHLTRALKAIMGKTSGQVARDPL